MKRIFLDANILFTAVHNPEGKASLMIELGTSGIWKIFTSAYALEEAHRNLEIKFPQCLERLQEISKKIDIVTTHGDPPCPEKLNDKDKIIFKAAVECGATHMLTGDIKDFGRYMNQPAKTSEILIQTVADFFQSVIQQQ